MHQMMPPEHNYLRNMMIQNSLLPFFHIPSQKHKENGAPQNRKFMEFTMPSLMELISPRSRYHRAK